MSRICSLRRLSVTPICGSRYRWGPNDLTVPAIPNMGRQQESKNLPSLQANHRMAEGPRTRRKYLERGAVTDYGATMTVRSFFVFKISINSKMKFQKFSKKIKTKKVIRNKKLTWLMNKSFITWKNRQSMVSWRRLVFAWPWRKWTKCRYIWIGSWTNRRISFARWVPRPTFAFPSPGWPSPSGQWTQRERVANLPSTFGSLLSKVPNFQKT